LQDTLLNGDTQTAYNQAIQALFTMQEKVKRPKWLESYSEDLLKEEVDLFPEWFLEKLLGISLDAQQKKQIAKLFDSLIDSALEQPQGFVHRDYHCRNLMMTSSSTASQDKAELALIDYQDAVWGPITYDLVSLARDCYVRWGEEEVSALVSAYPHKLGYLTEQQIAKFPKWFDLMGLQRHFKVLGIFARLALRDGKKNYLTDLPLVIRYCIEQLAKYPEFSDMHQWFINDLVPLAVKQPWYSDWQTAGPNLPIKLKF